MFHRGTLSSPHWRRCAGHPNRARQCSREPARQRTDIRPIDVCGNELRITVGGHINPGIGLVIQRVAERQTDEGCAVIDVITGIRRSWHDATADLRDIVVVLRWTAFHCVIARKGRIRIASHSSNRSRPNARRHAASEIEMHREPRGLVAVDDLDIGHTTAKVAG